MKITKNKGARAAALGIILAWVCIIAWAFYKQFKTDIIVLFFTMFITTALIPVFTMLTSKENKCHKKSATKI